MTLGGRGVGGGGGGGRESITPFVHIIKDGLMLWCIIIANL